MKPARRSTNFQQTRTSANAGGKEISVSISDATKAVAQNLDFTNMTPRAFSSAAQTMYDNGKIDMDQLFKMQMAAGGIFKNSEAPQNGNNKSVNYVQYFKDQLAGIISRGEANDPHSGYSSVVRILKVFTDR
jgi:hypothetical protein